VTFPNHVSIVTGRYPGHHGILNNAMVDPTITHQVFRLRDRAAVTNPAWWSAAEPIWVTASRQGRVSSTLFWPGSEVLINGIQPRDWLPYQHDLSSRERAERLLTWLTDIRPERPQADFATLYFSEVDSEGHAHGPDSAQVNQAIERVDAAIGLLINGLRDAGLWENTTLVIVSDHGMSHVPLGQTIDGASLLRSFPNARWEWTGPAPALRLGGESQEAVLIALSREPNLQCWPKALAPKRLGPLEHRRVPDVVCLARLGWSLSDRRLSFPIPGQHGFDPDHPEMQGFLIAHGPAIKPVSMGRVPNREVYLLLCRLLGIEAAAHDASGVLAEQILR
jgi:predicted AlkP superfamily pyrophosphatase or phosphodiesterase